MSGPNLSSLEPKSHLFSTLIVGALVSTAVVAAGNKGYEEYKDAKAVESQNETLMSVKSFLEENREKLKTYAALSPQAMASQAGSINAVLTELIKEMKKAKGAADEIKETDVRFNPVLFEELIIALELAILRLSPEDSKIGQLNRQAGKMSKSSGGWGFYNRAARRKGIDPNAVILMSNNVRKLKKVLDQLKSSIVALEKDGFKSCSDNSFVHSAIREKRGKDCSPKNSAFCEAVRASVTDGVLNSYSLKEGQIIAVQRKLIAFKVLSVNSETGVFDAASESAFSKAKESEAFVEELEECEEG